jgi:hypothetical protein
MELDVYQVIKDLMKEYPNDMELGRKVRDFINGVKKIKEEKNGVQQKVSL